MEPILRVNIPLIIIHLLYQAYGINLLSMNTDKEMMRCSKCNIQMDHNGRHALNCKCGKGIIWRHDEVNKCIANLISEHTQNYQWEPKKLDEQNDQRPDIIVHDELMKIKDKMVSFYMDTMITDIYNKENLRYVNSNKFHIFNAGKLAEKVKIDLYLDRFNELKDKNYIFIPTIIESHGGLNKGLRNVINLFLKRIAKEKNKDESIMIHNFYIKFSIFYQKLKYQSIWNHYRIL